jgi:hypothetical protein
MTETTGADLERRQQELQAELARLEHEKREQAEAQRRQERAEREAQLDPELRAKKEQIERRANEVLDREWPPAWQPQKAESGQPAQIIGLVLRIDPKVGPSKFGGYSAVLELRTTDEQEWTVWASHEGALYAQMLRQRIQPGEVVAIRYRGQKDSEANPGQSYHDFKLRRVDDDEEPSAPIDYDALQRDRETPALPPPEHAPAPDDDIPF